MEARVIKFTDSEFKDAFGNGGHCPRGDNIGPYMMQKERREAAPLLNR